MPHNHEIFQSPGFFDLWSPIWIIIVALLIAGYIKVTSKASAKEPVPFMQKFYFIFGLILLFGAEGSPLSYYGHHFLFSFHMIQMAIAYLAVPPLLLLGTPAWLIRPFISKPKVKKVVWFMTNPLLAILLFNALFSFYHIPRIFDAAMSHPAFHFVYHIALFASAVLMYWLIACPVPEFNRLSSLVKLAYIFGNGVLLTPACALIIFSDSVLYTAYANATQIFASMPPLEDQQLGGTLMKILQEIIYGIALGAVFFSWAKKERAKDRDELESMQANRSNLTPKVD